MPFDDSIIINGRILYKWHEWQNKTLMIQYKTDKKASFWVEISIWVTLV